jgi:ABC-type multidrug transport system ATPase subunit
MDEPTSGLDARSAATVMMAVRNVAGNGRTVMVTIHQPSIEIFESFDRLVLLGPGGHAIYIGELGERSSKLVDYLQVRSCLAVVHSSCFVSSLAALACQIRALALEHEAP